MNTRNLGFENFRKIGHTLVHILLKQIKHSFTLSSIAYKSTKDKRPKGSKSRRKPQTKQIIFDLLSFNLLTFDLLSFRRFVFRPFVYEPFIDTFSFPNPQTFIPLNSFKTTRYFIFSMRKTCILHQALVAEMNIYNTLGYNSL